MSLGQKLTRAECGRLQRLGGVAECASDRAAGSKANTDSGMHPQAGTAWWSAVLYSRDICRATQGKPRHHAVPPLNRSLPGVRRGGRDSSGGRGLLLRARIRPEECLEESAVRVTVFIAAESGLGIVAGAT